MTIGWKTLDVDHQALIYDAQGRGRIEEGPKRIFLFRERFNRLQRYSADQTQYIIVKHINGTIEHLPGPCVLFRNPLIHHSVSTMTGVSLDANEVLVAYRLNESSNQVSRFIHYGPTLFIPQANEWLHEFVWHGTDESSKTRKIPGQLKFQKLRVIPDQFYYNVDEVRTADDAVIVVKLMLFYELKDIEGMLNSTQDPIADFINCVCADVVAYAAKLTYMEFIEKSGELNDLRRYPQLLDRCKMIGYEMSKVVFRGYHAHQKLQTMHDNAIAQRAKLKIDYEKEEQHQDLTDFKLRSEMERITLEQNMALEAIEHSHTMEKGQLDHKLTMDDREQEEKIKQWRERKEAHIQAKEAEDDQKLGHYGKLNAMSVNLTDYLVSQTDRPDKVVRVINNDNTAKLHFHQNGLMA